MRRVNNPFNLTKEIAILRVRRLDPLAVIEIQHVTEVDEATFIHRMAVYIGVESNLSDSALAELFNQPQTAEEQAVIANYSSAASGFENLPNWSTWTQAEFDTWCSNNLMTDAQIDAANLSAALKANLKANNAFTRNGGKAILFIRDYIIKTRR